MIEIISLIVSVYNEESGLEQFYKTTKQKMDELISEKTAYDYDIYFVNDGSTDSSAELLDKIHDADPRHVKLISFSRNFGHEAAMTAGLDYADGDYLIFMDADLQHPPACIPDIIECFEKGYEIINMVRTQNDDQSAFGRLASGMFYNIINRISDAKIIPAASDFFAINGKAAAVLKNNYREKVRFLRGFVQNIGFNKTTLEYEAGTRVAGHSHYSFGKLLKLSMDAVTCFSDMPLKFGIYAGLFSGFLGVLLIIYTLFTRNGAPSGYATIVIVLCFMFAVLFMLLGIMGSYISILFREMKDRPIYIIRDIKGHTDPADGKTGK
ncbi:MAG: glycosyltransferase family 2 protein [Eubacteriales bacterium]|nr:glycosyltransferase family 2 protein [Eubacteriales bacterium]